MDKAKIDRINALAKKAKSPEGLTEEERTEQAALRQEYLKQWRESFTQQLEHTYIQYPDGTRRKLKRKDG